MIYPLFIIHAVDTFTHPGGFVVFHSNSQGTVMHLPMISMHIHSSSLNGTSFTGTVNSSLEASPVMRIMAIGCCDQGTQDGGGE